MKWLWLVVALACSKPERGVNDDFHAVERLCIQRFNDALHRQGRGELDELGLAEVIDRDVLPPWRAMRARTVAAGASPAMRRYLDDRETAWAAYSAALHAPDDAAARPHYDVYHQKNAEADRDARELAGELQR